MKPKKYSSEGIVLARKNYSEADRILVVYSKYYGKVMLMAKGVRKLKSRKRSSLEVFSRIKFAATRGKSIDLMTEVDLIESFNGSRKNLKKVSVAYFFLEVIGRLTREDQKNEDLYKLLLDYLRGIGRTSSLKSLRNEFIYNVLVILGFWPKGKKMDDADSVLENIIERQLFSARVGKRILS